MAAFVRPRFLLRTIMIASTWMAGAVFSAHVPDDGAQRRAEELAPAPAPSDIPTQHLAPATRPASRPSEAPPLIDPPSPTPA
ncbi:MAG: hypothetical protein ABI183_07590 [Polyangiaceae bacterium]